MSILLHGDCLEHMKDIDNDSIDFIFCDLPYGQTSCKWDCCIDLEKFWIEVMRIKKINTPIFMTTTTKFGVSLINSAPKKCPFRYDLVWVKSAPAGFLSAKKMPMRKHEMVYVFYEKLPLYDLSSHTHKFIKETVNKINGKDGVDNKGMIKNRSKTEIQNKYDPPLPVSVVKEPNTINTLYGDEVEVPDYVNKRNKKTGMSAYEPPLPVSVVKEDYETCNKPKRKMIYGNMEVFEPKRRGEPRYDPPLPTTMLEIKSTKGKHSTQKPVELMEWLLKYFSKEGDTVLDPTMGSGSTGVACKNMNRNFIGIELDPEIYEVAVNRIEE
jgi:DNA modification methylase